MGTMQLQLPCPLLEGEGCDSQQISLENAYLHVPEHLAGVAPSELLAAIRYVVGYNWSSNNPSLRAPVEECL